MRGRPADWAVELDDEPLGVALAGLAGADVISGIWVDRAGYSDRGQALESELAPRLRVAPLVSDDQRFAYYPLTSMRKAVAQALDGSQMRELERATLEPVRAMWDKGFYGLEELPTERWRWGRRQATLRLVNPGPRPRQITIRSLLQTSSPGSWPLLIQGVGPTRSIRIEQQERTEFASTLTIPVGETKIRFTTTAPETIDRADPRPVAVRFTDLRVTENALLAAVLGPAP